MKLKLGKIVQIVGQVWPVIRDTVEAASADSPGGKRITPEERNIIIKSALSRIGVILEEHLPR